MSQADRTATPPRAPEAAPVARSGGSALWHDWVKPFLMVLVVVCSLRSAVADWNDVPSGSMRPTILEGERIFVNKLAYDLKVPFTRIRIAEWGEPERGDVVVLYSPENGKRLVKRVVGLPGDQLAMRDGRLYVDGTPAEYQPLETGDRAELGLNGEPPAMVVWERIGARTHPVTWTPMQPNIRSFGPLQIPADSFFVMGDNRDNSRDSRWFGFVDRELIVGEAKAVVVSLDPEHYFAPRWDRFFFGLP
ncbi:MAG TPA: signal peptidase I [Thermoanaerobaculia bacterium]|nr:signal peptidase I [Thermoanaerobaculia bacterium]